MTAAAWTAPLIIAPPLYSRDVYSYLAQGAVALRGFDPYSRGAAVLDLPLRGNVAGLWQETPSPYGPLFLLLGKGTVWLLRSQGPLLTWMSLPATAAELLYFLIGRYVPGFTHLGFLTFFRAAGVVVLAGVLVRQWWLAREGGVEAVRRATIALLAASLLAPSVLPWYFTWALALGATFAWKDRRIAVLAGVSVWMVLVTLPDGTIVARWTYDSMNPWVWWPYLAATVVAGMWVGRALLHPARQPAPVAGGTGE